MNDDRNRSQIIRIDARNCFVESLNDAFEIGTAHFTFASYDLSKPSGPVSYTHLNLDIFDAFQLGIGDEISV